MSIISHHQILHVHAAAITVGLTTSRRELLTGIPPSVVTTFPRAATDAAQLLADLDRLNDFGRLPDGSVPLRAWLDNALALCGPRTEAEVFREVLTLLPDPGGATTVSAMPSAGTASAATRGATFHLHIQDSTIGSIAVGKGATSNGGMDMRQAVKKQPDPATATAASGDGHRISHGTEVIHPVTSAGEVSHKLQDTTPPFRIERLELSNLRGITSIELDFTASSSLPGQWTCLVGSNGAGKSTILQGVTLAMLGDHLVPELGHKRLAKLRRRGSDALADTEIHAWVRDGEVLRELYIPLGVGGLNQEALNANKQIVAMREFWRKREANLIFAAYGARRSLSWHRDERDNHLSIDVRRQMTLFEPSAQMASTGLLAERGGKMSPVFDTFRSLVDAVFDDLSVRVVEDDGIKFSVDDVVIAPDELSDGYRTTIGWLLDLCAAWHDKAPALARQGDLSSMHGVVLIDEIDLHLHPRWQRSVVTNLRRTLPGVQWIVSTHSPLALSSFDLKEVLVIEHGRCAGRGHEFHDLTMSPNLLLIDPPPSEAATDDLAGSGPARQMQVAESGLLQSTFISYGGPDETFARKLYDALRRNGVRCFLFSEHAVPGEKLHRTMRNGIQKHDRVILICSRASLDRRGVLVELEEALAREHRDGADYLIPIRLDDYVFKDWAPKNPDVAQAVRDKVVADFEGADQDEDKFQSGILRLLAALRK